MSERQARQYTEIARGYEVHAARFPDGSQGRIANLSEAVKYHGLAEQARRWPDPEPHDSGVARPCTCYGPPLPSHWEGCPAAPWNQEATNPEPHD